MKKTLLFVLSATAVGTSLARDRAGNDAANAEAPVAPPAYRSAFEGYRPYREPELASWREANEAMARLRGHMGHLKGEPQAPKDEHRGGHR